MNKTGLTPCICSKITGIQIHPKHGGSGGKVEGTKVGCCGIGMRIHFESEATMRMKRTIFLFLLPALLLTLTGCEYRSKSDKYYLISNNMGLAYWKTAIAGFNKAAAQYRVTAIVDGPQNYDTEAELHALQRAIAAKPAGILLSVSDQKSLQPEIDRALDAGIPVITIDSDAPYSHRLFFIGTNNLEAGHLGGERVVEKLGGKGSVVFFSIPGQPNLDERLKGYREVFANHPGIKVMDVFNMRGESVKAFDMTQQYLALTGPAKIDAFVCLEASAGKDVGEVLKRQKAHDRLLIAMDVDQDTLNLIKDGIIDATVAQKPFTMAFYGLKALDDIHRFPPKHLRSDFSVNSFSPYPVFVDTGTALVDKTNVDLYSHGAAEAER
jgi:ribose transport system substrate-binding protein